MNKTSRRERRAELMLFLLAMIWGGSFVAAKFTMESFDVYWVMVLRFFIGAFALWVLFPGEHKKVDRTTLRGGAEVGILLGIGTAFQMVGLRYTTPANQTFIIVSYVITVPLLHYAVSGIKPGKNIMLAAVFTIVGVGFLTIGPSFRLNIGDVLTFVMALLFAVQMIRIDYWMPQVESSIIFTMAQLIAAGVISLVLFFIYGGRMQIAPLTTASVGGLIYMVVLNTAVAFFLQNYAQRYASPEKSALIISSESLFGTFAAYFFAGEEFYAKKIVGCVLILIGQFLAQVLPMIRKMAREKKINT
ncbi:MAG: DMT family transporter [Peptoniphilus sp.]|nr:DMT family transporter [Peptoniphilus sp.]MDD7363489.1 DMT family transporter [Bacillota bacterium]MDY6044807.1 DMT family transporter [Peptoniphilus sp.]